MSAPVSTPTPFLGIIIVDVENSFGRKDGSLYVTDGEQVVPVCNELRTLNPKVTVLTADAHPAEGPHVSFASTHGQAPFTKKTFSFTLSNGEVIESEEMVWPDHCRKGSEGHKWCDGLKVMESDLIQEKGQDPNLEFYSAFASLHKIVSTGLSAKLKAQGITHTVLGGLALDYCVGNTALDAKDEGFEVCVVLDACRSVAPETEAIMLAKLKAKGVILVQTVAEAKAWFEASA
jgi:nicotinamidase/pyrazinamidase